MRPSLAGVGFIFDCDGTLLDTMDAWLSMEDTFASRVGGRIDSSMREALCTMTMPEEAVFLHETFGVGASPAELEAEIDEYFMSYYSERAEMTPGAGALIEEVRRLQREKLVDIHVLEREHRRVGGFAQLVHGA